MFRTPHKKGIEGYSYYDYCKKCHVQQSQSTRYKLLYNITSEEYDKILKLQKGRCAICGNFPKNFRLAVDHCHKTGLIRGLLCWRCNNAIGKFNDSQTLIFSAFVYLFSSPAAIALGEKRYGVIGRVSRKAKNRAYGGPNLEEKQHKIDPVKLMEYLKNWWGTEHYASEVYEKPETKKAIIRRTKTRL
jgi:hypothetical protein